MGYSKGIISREQIVRAAATVVLAKGYGAASTADLVEAAHTSAGKMTHHFPTKMDLFEAVFAETTGLFRTGPLTLLGDRTQSPQRRIDVFFDAMHQLYARLADPIGCPIGHAAGNSEGVSASMRAQAFSYLEETENLFEAAFRDMGDSPSLSRAKAIVFVNTWQGAVVGARAGGGLRYIEKVFSNLQKIKAVRHCS